MVIQKISVVALAVSLLAAAIPAFAVTPTPGVPSEKSRAVRPAVNIACMQMSVDKRESILSSAIGVYGAALQAAYSARKTALRDAWTKTDAKERNAAIKAVWATFHKAKKTAKEHWRTAQQPAWKQFRADAKACKVSNHPDDERGSRTDSDI